MKDKQHSSKESSPDKGRNKNIQTEEKKPGTSNRPNQGRETSGGSSRG